MTPDFLSLEEVLAIHRGQLSAFGGQDGIRDLAGLQSALGQAGAVFSFLVPCDLYDIAAAYAFHISENQPFVDGNKRTGLNAALLFLAINDVTLSRADDGHLFAAMIAVANNRMTRAGFADVLRKHA